MKNNKILKNVLFLALVLVGFTVSAQVRMTGTAITAAANGSAFIDASSNVTNNGTVNIGKGLVFPRVDLTTFTFGSATTGIPNSFPGRYDGMIVYNTATGNTTTGTPVSAVTPGFYFYENKSATLNGGAWKPVGSSSSGSSSSISESVVSAYSCSTASAGSITVGVPVSGVTQTITATVTTPGFYAISTNTVNGVTFLGMGIFAGTGAQNIVLTATGTPTAIGPFSYTLGTTPSCSFDRVAFPFVPTITSTTGEIWMDRNLGATQVATSATDYLSYGHLYQWGRKADGHQIITWTNATTGVAANGTTTTKADVPANALFITVADAPYDWRVNLNDNLWNGAGAVNNPCPLGFRVPTSAEITAEVTAYGITNSATAFSSPLKFTVPGIRYNLGGALNFEGSYGYYWTSSVSGADAAYRRFNSGGTLGSYDFRAYGYTVRCIKD